MMVKVDFCFEISWTFFYCRAKGQHWTGAQHVSKNTARGATNVPSSGLRHNTHDHNFDRNKNHDDYHLDRSWSSPGRTTAAGRRQRSTSGCGSSRARKRQQPKRKRQPKNNKYEICKSVINVKFNIIRPQGSVTVSHNIWWQESRSLKSWSVRFLTSWAWLNVNNLLQLFWLPYSRALGLKWTLHMA